MMLFYVVYPPLENFPSMPLNWGSNVEARSGVDIFLVEVGVGVKREKI